MMHRETSIKGFLDEINDMRTVLNNVVSQTIAMLEDDGEKRRVYRFEWNIRGLFYHLENVIDRYIQFAEDVRNRLNGFDSIEEIPVMLIINSPSVNTLMFEFYALVNLSKVTLDNFSKLLYPLFNNVHLPKSISDLSSGTTNCPMYERLANDYHILYLRDLRNCIVHYRTFATTENAAVILEGTEPTDLPLDSLWLSSMTQAVYRTNEERKLVTNIYLPDKIFQKNEDGSDKKLAQFTYGEKNNILSMAMRFVRNILFSTIEATAYLQRRGNFEYKKDGFEQKVDYIEFTT